MWNLLTTALCLFSFIALTGPAGAQDSLRIGVPMHDPIAYQQGDDFDGIAIDLWREIYAGSGQPYELFEVDAADPLTSLGTGDADVILGVRPVASKVGNVLYTQPFVTSSLAYATTGHEPSLGAYANAFFNRRLAWIAFWVCCILLIVGIVCWTAERRGNEKQFRRSPHHGIWDGFYWAGVTMTTIGYGDKVPTTTLGKVVALLWMLAAIGVSSVLTASVVSVVDQVRNEGSIGDFPGDLKDKKIAAVGDSPAASFLQKHRIEFDTAQDLDQAMKLLQDGEVEAVVDSDIRLQAMKANSSVVVRSTWLQPQGYTIAVAPDSEDLFKQLNRQILQHTSQPDWNARIERYTRQK